MGKRICPRKIGITIVLAAVFILAISVAAFGLKPFKVGEYVTDQAGILSDATRTQLATLLDEYGKQTTNQILVVTVPSLEGDNEIDFTEELFKLNQPGQKGKDNGIIFMVAVEDRKMRIEVGYGLEGEVPDGKAGTIMREQVAPYFKQGDYNSGITSGTFALIQAITPDYPLPSKPGSGPTPTSDSGNDGLSIPGIIIIMAIIGIISWLSSLRNTRRVRRGYSEPWFWGGGGGGGFSGGSGGSGGGFSGGGGSFGGGGSSGSW
jgi:uncharacterized protein